MNVMRLFSIRNSVLGTLTVAVLLGASTLTYSQNREYRQYQRAAQEAQRECYNYQRSGGRSDYRRCQEAQARAQRELADSQRSSNGYNNGYYNNNSYYNNGSTTVYNPRTGQTYRVYNNGRYYST